MFYSVLMLHLIGDTCMYLGVVGLDYNESDDPVEVMEKFWDEFQDTQPEHNHLFTDWLGEQNKAKEVMFDDDSPNSPSHVYLKAKS